MSNSNTIRKYKAAVGFTLIELMVVISIITLLTALLLPAIGRAKRTSQTTVCLTRVKGLASSILVYATDNDGPLPMNGIFLPKPGPGTGPGSKWPSGDVDLYGVYDKQKWDLPYGALWDYTTRSRKAFICPEEDFLRPNKDQIIKGDDGTIGVRGYPPEPGGGKGYFSYAVNSVLNSEGRFRENFAFRGGAGKTPQPWQDPIRILDSNQVKRPAEFIMILEEEPTKSRFNDEVMDAPAYNGASTNGADFLTNRHANGGGSVGFADGHCESMNATLFNNVPAGITPAGANNDWNAMQSPITRMFFPDGGEFVADQGPSASAPATGP